MLDSRHRVLSRELGKIRHSVSVWKRNQIVRQGKATVHECRLFRLLSRIDFSSHQLSVQTSQWPEVQRSAVARVGAALGLVSTVLAVEQELQQVELVVAAVSEQAPIAANAG